MPRAKKIVTDANGATVEPTPLELAATALRAATAEVVKLPISENVDKLALAAIAYRELFAAKFK